ncbi:hypothetical protein GE061_002147 [Apolygus lucorum]|uniref:SAM domain-containing protein n=1 Tax=Apolygus lucorum TaxID=248454 RepID=A0A8S9X489_APOLU|nr:hypothetical protein GE061_002147 [Apolygus lucorum]
MMVSSSCNNTSRRSLPKKEKIIPSQQLGVEALPTINKTMQGVLDWLKTERLHKYWPVFSRMTYTTLVGLNEGNLEHALTCIGSDPITNGARGRILRCTERLRERSNLLNAINEHTPLDDIADIFLLIASTPLSASENEPNGLSLVKLFRQKLNQVVGYYGPEITKNYVLRKALLTYIGRSEVPESDKEYIERLFNNLKLAARSGTSPKGCHQKLSPPSSPQSLVSSSSASPHGKQNQVQQRPISPLSPSTLRPLDCSIPLPKPPPLTGAQKTSFPAKEEKPTYPGFTHPPPGLHFPYFNIFGHAKADGSGSMADKPKPTCRPLCDRPAPSPTNSRPLYGRSTPGPTISYPLYDRSTPAPPTSRPLYGEHSPAPTTGRPLYDRRSPAPKTSRPLYDRSTPAPTTSSPLYDRSMFAPPTSRPLYGERLPASTTSNTLNDRPFYEPIKGRMQNCLYQCQIPSPQCQTNYDWPDPRLENAFMNLSLNDLDLSISPISIGASVESSLDLNKLWGGTKNQVMLDLNVTSRSRIRS